MTTDFISRTGQRFRKTLAQNTMLKQKLQQEVQSHDDMLVVPVLETYRNLADKLLHFMHW